MKIFELLSKLITKQVKPKVYAIGLRNNILDMRRVWLGVSYSFEEAFLKASNEIIKDFPNSPMWKPEMWIFSEIEDLILPFCDVKIKEEIPKETIKKVDNTEKDKNELLKRIILENNTKLFEEKKNIFTKEEKQLVEDELKKFSQKS